MPRLRIRLTFAVPALLLFSLTACTVAAVSLYVSDTGERPSALSTTALMIVSGISVISAIAVCRIAVGAVAAATAAMQKLANGEIVDDLPPARLTEMAALATSFNAMAARLQKSRQMLVRQAFHDPLTGLANRASFMAQLTKAIADEHGKNPVAILFIDLDRFKVVNDTLGHGVGDSLLTIVGTRLSAAVGANATVARLGGDEFTAMLQGPNVEARAVEVADMIIRRMQRPVSVAGHEIFVSASVGISISDGHKTTITEMLRQADIALYRAKSEGKGRFVLFKALLHDVNADSLDLDSALHRAIEREQLKLVYQPEIDLRSGAVVGMEALLRWEHPHLGVLSPGQFIAMAEESGEIGNIGQWVLETACRETMELEVSYPPAAELIVSVNLSAAEFRDPFLADRIREALHTSGLPPKRLRLELTESVLVEDVQATVAVLQSLRRLGVQLAIDDFGTGYSSLSYIQWFDVGTLKVDQSFVGRIGRDQRSNAIVDAIADLAGSLGMSLTAEGVETADQLAYLSAARYHRAQGHYISPPLDYEVFIEFLRTAAARPFNRQRSIHTSGLQRSA